MIELNNVPEIPLSKEFDRALSAFNKKAAGIMIPKFLKALSTASEPFFRKNMGERHFGANELAGGFGLWGAATLLSAMFGMAFLRFGGGLAFCVGGAVTAAFLILGSIDSAYALQCRMTGKTYHSRSPGVSRWGDKGGDWVITIVASIALLITSPVVGVCFIASRVMSANRIAQQQAALWERYLDALDQKIESELLQEAILGKQPPEITYLYKPLSPGLKPELRENIAAAAVGKPVKIVAQPPQPTTAATSAPPNP